MTSSPDLPVPEDLSSEVRRAVHAMKKGSASGYHGITVDVLQLTGEETYRHLAKVFSH